MKGLIHPSAWNECSTKFVWAACSSLLTASLHTLHALSCELLAPATHEDRGAPEDVEVWGRDIDLSRR
jgi:hypothetical protein